MNDKKTLKKIKDLFILRRIPELLKLSGIEKNGAFVKKLYELQAAIYRLDNYLESNWKLRKSEANVFWKDIYTALKNLGYSKKEAVRMCSEIQKYQDFEWALRSSKPKNRKSLYSTYRTKSCDVALMRKLIYLESGKAKNKILPSDWRYFDLITEVNDDIQDLKEDCSIYNGNNLLISVLQNGKPKARKIYSRFIREITKKAKQRFKNDRNNPLSGWISQQSKATNKLLTSQLKKTPISAIKKSKLAKKL